MAFVVVQYQYSTSSDRVLTKQATWTGQVPGRSLATVMSELRRLHRRATNISISEVRWVQGGDGDAEARGQAPDPGHPCPSPSCA